MDMKTELKAGFTKQKKYAAYINEASSSIITALRELICTGSKDEIGTAMDEVYALFNTAGMKSGAELANELRLFVRNEFDQESTEQTQTVSQCLDDLRKYIGCIRGGAPDQAGLLLDGVNEVRLLRGQKPKAREVIINSDFRVKVAALPDIKKYNANDAENVVASAKKKLPEQFAHWLLNKKDRDVLHTMSTEVRSLVGVVSDTRFKRYLCLGACLLNGVGGLEDVESQSYTRTIRLLIMLIDGIEKDTKGRIRAHVEADALKELTFIVARMTPTIKNSCTDKFKADFSALSLGDALISEGEGQLNKFHIQSGKKRIFKALADRAEKINVLISKLKINTDYKAQSAIVDALKDELSRAVIPASMVESEELHGSFTAIHSMLIAHCENDWDIGEQDLLDIINSALFCENYIKSNLTDDHELLHLSSAEKGAVKELLAETTKNLLSLKAKIFGCVEAGKQCDTAQLKNSLASISGGLAFVGYPDLKKILDNVIALLGPDVSTLAEDRGSYRTIAYSIEGVLSVVNDLNNGYEYAEDIVLACLGEQSKHDLNKEDGCDNVVNDHLDDGESFKSEISDIAKYIDNLVNEEKGDVTERLVSTLDQLYVAAELHAQKEIMDLSDSLRVTLKQANDRSITLDRHGDSIVGEGLQYLIKVLGEYSALEKVEWATSSIINKIKRITKTDATDEDELYDIAKKELIDCSTALLESHQQDNYTPSSDDVRALHTLRGTSRHFFPEQVTTALTELESKYELLASQSRSVDPDLFKDTKQLLRSLINGGEGAVGCSSKVTRSLNDQAKKSDKPEGPSAEQMDAVEELLDNSSAPMEILREEFESTSDTRVDDLAQIKQNFLHLRKLFKGAEQSGALEVTQSVLKIIDKCIKKKTDIYCSVKSVYLKALNFLDSAIGNAARFTQTQVPKELLDEIYESWDEINELRSITNAPQPSVDNHNFSIDSACVDPVPEETVVEIKVEETAIEIQRDKSIPEAQAIENLIEKGEETSKPIRESDSETHQFVEDELVEYDMDMVELILRDDLDEILPELRNHFNDWKSGLNVDESAQGIKRCVHTLKGNSAQCKANCIVEVAHKLEDLFEMICGGVIEADQRLYSLVTECIKYFEFSLNRVLENEQVITPIKIISFMEEALTTLKVPDNYDFSWEVKPILRKTGFEVCQPEKPKKVEATDNVVKLKTEHLSPEQPPQNYQVKVVDDNSDSTPQMLVDEYRDELLKKIIKGKSKATTKQKIKVEEDLINKSIKLVGEATAKSSNLDPHLALLQKRMEDAEYSLSYLNKQFTHLDGLMRTAFNSMMATAGTLDGSAKWGANLGLERFNAAKELTVRMDNLCGELYEQVCEAQTELESLTRSRSIMHGKVLEVGELLSESCMISFQPLSQQLKDLTKQTSQELGKKVQLQFDGSDVRVDNSTMSGLKEPLQHIIRNSIAHGIESPSERGNKPETGQIRVSTRRRGKKVIIQVSDDGRGIDLVKVREKAIDLGLMDEADEKSNDELARLILQSGFSTASSVSNIAGRGVGMDVVNNRVKKLGGEISIKTETGRGAAFNITFPFRSGTNKALICSVGKQFCAIPTDYIKEVASYGIDVYRKMFGESRTVIEHMGDSYFRVNMAELMGMPTSWKQGESGAFLFTNIGNVKVAIEVNEIIESRDIHINSVDNSLDNVAGIMGYTELGDGRVSFVYDLGELASINLEFSENRYRCKQNRITGYETKNKTTALVIDDSGGFRNALKKLLSDRGLFVHTATDGQKGLFALDSIQKPNIIFLDAEMPILNGLGFAEEIRKTQNKDIPIVMLTSRTSQEIKDKAISLGVREFMNKPIGPGELDAIIDKFALEESCAS